MNGTWGNIRWWAAASIDHTKGEITRTERKIKNQQLDLTKINDLISRNTNAQEKLAEANFNMESAIVHRLQVVNSLTCRGIACSCQGASCGSGSLFAGPGEGSVPSGTANLRGARGQAREDRQNLGD